MTFETLTTASPEEVIDRALAFFTRRDPAYAAFPERTAPGFLILRGQGGEEIVVAATAAPGGTSVRGSTMLYGQQVNRFFTTLPSVPMARPA